MDLCVTEPGQGSERTYCTRQTPFPREQLSEKPGRAASELIRPRGLISDFNSSGLEYDTELKLDL